MKSYIMAVIPIYMFWIVLSERLTVESLVIGFFISCAVILYNKKTIDFNKRFSTAKPKLIFKFLAVLLCEIVLSNLQVAKIVLSRKIAIEPNVFQYKTKLKSDRYRAVFANSITLTPGTITVGIDSDVLTVHGLRKENREGVINSKIEKILIEMEEVSNGY